MLPPPTARARAARAGAIAVLVGALASGCSTWPVPPAPTPSATVSAPDPTPVATPTGPAFVPDGSAADNLPWFTQVVQSVWAGPEPVAGRAYIDALAAAGFDKSAMQVTNDQSTVGNPAESIQFSVRWGEDCLIGQVGPETGDPVTTVQPGLPEGGCLIGHTRPIDW